MSATVLLYDPRPVPAEVAGEASRALAGLAGMVVGFIDNAKPNFNHLVDDLAELLVTRHGVKAVIKRRKPIATVPATDAVLEELSRECDLVIAGSGD
jgi:hypothetical protein